MKRRIKIPLYSGHLEIRIIDDLGTIREEFNDYEAVTLYKGTTATICLQPKYITPGLIAHEAKHALNHFFDCAGVKLDLHNDEPECYLLGWIVNRVHETVSAYKKKNYA